MPSHLGSGPAVDRSPTIIHIKKNLNRCNSPFKNSVNYSCVLIFVRNNVCRNSLSVEEWNYEKSNNENWICFFPFSVPSPNMFSYLSVFEGYKWSFSEFSSKSEIPSAKSLTASKVPCFHNRKVPDYKIVGWKLEQSFFPMSLYY